MVASRREILPESRAKRAVGTVMVAGRPWIRVYCANCGKNGGIVPEESCTFAFYLCDPCAETWGDKAHFYLEPDAIFFERVQHEQLEKLGRQMSHTELFLELEDPNSPLAKLCKDHERQVRMRKGMT